MGGITAGQPAPSNPFESDGDHHIHTTSRLQMWRLTCLDRYRVAGTGLIPRTTLLGRTRYTRVWDLLPPEIDTKKA